MIIADASVLRNFAILNWIEELAVVSGGTILAVHGVMSVGEDDVGDIDRILEAVQREAEELVGTVAGSRWMAAVVGLEKIRRQEGRLLDVLEPDASETEVAVRLSDRTQREFLDSLGVGASRLDTGEAASLAVAVGRDLEFATDDDVGRLAYEALGGIKHCWTRDLVVKAVDLKPPDRGTGAARVRDID